MRKPSNSSRPSSRRPTRRIASRKPSDQQQPGSVPVYSVFGRAVGAIEEGTLRKHVHGSTHMLRKPLGWAWDMNILRQAARARVRQVEVIDLDSGILYRAELSDFGKHGVSFDRGFGPQTCLPLDHWKTSGWEPKTIFRFIGTHRRSKSEP